MYSPPIESAQRSKQRPPYKNVQQIVVVVVVGPKILVENSLLRLHYCVGHGKLQGVTTFDTPE